MRINKRENLPCEFRMLTLDDDQILTATLQSYFSRGGYSVDVENDPIAAIETIRNGHYDILLLDYMMTPITGDRVVERIREFNKDLFIILLTGHREIVPPVVTIRSLDIQGYFEKSDKYDQLEMLVESCAKSIRQMRTIKKYQEQLTEMAALMPEIQTADNPAELVTKIADASARLFGAESVLVAIDDPSTGEKIRQTRGAGFPAADYLPISKISGVIGEMGVLNASVTDNDGKDCGIIAVKTPAPADYYDRQRFNIFVRQCISAADNVFLLARVKDGYTDLIHAIRLLVDAKDEKTRGHSDRVAEIASRMGREVGLSPEAVEHLRLAGVFHDIGKVAVPDSILKSSSKLTPEEYSEIKKHPAAGAQILAAIPSFADVAPIVRSHHERIDGRGYPDGLTGDKLSEEAKIIAVADTYDAMISNRSYATEKNFGQVIEEMKRIRGTQLDGGYVDLLIGILEKEGRDFSRDISDKSIRTGE